jgi:hypothetical protein
MNLEIIDSDEGYNEYYILNDKFTNRKYVAMHIVNGKFAFYNHEFHDIIKIFKWYPNNGYASSILRQEHIDQIPDLPLENDPGRKKTFKTEMISPFALNRQIYMHLLIKIYILGEPKILLNKHDEFRTVFHHINGWNRDNRIDNMMWIGRYEQISIFKVFGKLFKPPVEVRHLSMYLPKYVKWINAKRCYRIDEHPVIFTLVKSGESKHKYWSSLIGKKTTPIEKYLDVMQKYEQLQNTPYYQFPTYVAFLEKMEQLKLENKLMLQCVQDYICNQAVKDLVRQIFETVLSKE